jgi:diguanylate cyclase (GGDEF)-like protein/PAS domain S-box-containing protein
VEGPLAEVSFSSEQRLDLPEMPILLLFCDGSGDSSVWREKLHGISEAVFCTRHEAEALAVLSECEKLGTPAGLVVLVGQQWGSAMESAVSTVRGGRTETQLPLFVACESWEQREVYRAVELGVREVFEAPFDWGLIERKGRRAVYSAAETMHLNAGKQHAETLLVQHKQTVLSQDFWRLDLTTRSVEFSPNFRKLSGFTADEIQGSLDECLTLIHPLDLSRLSKVLSGSDWRALPEELNFEFRLRHRNGGWRWVLMRGRIERDAESNPIGISGSHTDITDSKTIDPITGLSNRMGFEEWLQEHVEQGGLQLGVFLIALERYSLIRDSLGQGVGDQLVRVAADRLSEVMGPGEKGSRDWVVARLNTEEFAVALPGIADHDKGRQIGERIQQEMARGIWLEGQDIYLSTSVGYVLQEERRSAEELWRDAEIAMHAARAEGGNRVCAFVPNMRQNVLERMALENDLKRALEQWEFEIYYQPKVELRGERIIGFEALLRWRHPVKGIVPPMQFIPLAEESGLIIPIGIRTIREACRTIRDWQEEFPQPRPLEVSVNLSVKQFQDRHLLEEIRSVLAETQIPPSTLQIEVTESVLVDDPAQALQLVTELRKMGVGLKIDDFGTGYSSLSYLHKLPFDTLKIDRSFVSTMGEDHAAYEIVRAIILLAGSLGLQVVAEGVETKLQAEELRNLGCGFGQGYLFSPPLTGEAARRMLSAQCLRMSEKRR